MKTLLIALLLLSLSYNLTKAQNHLSPDFKPAFTKFYNDISAFGTRLGDSVFSDSLYMEKLQMVVEDMRICSEKAATLADCIAIISLTPIGNRYFIVPAAYKGTPLATQLESRQAGFHRVIYGKTCYVKAIERLNMELVWTVQPVPNNNGYFNYTYTLRKPDKDYPMEILALARLMLPNSGPSGWDKSLSEIVYPEMRLNIAQIQGFPEGLWLNMTVEAK